MIYNFRVDNLILKCTNSTKTIITDSVKYHIARFEFDKDWENYSKTIIFTNSYTNQSISVLLNENNECIIPWEVLEYKNKNAKLIVAVQGVNEDDSQIWTYMEKPLVLIKSDKNISVEGQEPTKDIYTKIFEEINKKGSINYDENSRLLILNNDNNAFSIELGTEDENIDFDNIFDFSETESSEDVETDDNQNQDNNGQNLAKEEE